MKLTVEQIIKWLIYKDIQEKATKQTLSNRGYEMYARLAFDTTIEDIEYLDIVRWLQKEYPDYEKSFDI